MTEIWKPIPGFEGFYEASSLGRVKSIERTIITKSGKVQTFRSRILKQDFLNRGQGYYRVCLCIGCKEKRMLVHRLVMWAFIGIKDISVDHINGDSTDNRLENLRYCTHRDNLVTYRRKNTHKTSSKYVGVCLDKRSGKYCANISINGKNKSLGSFHSEFQAHLAYERALKERIAIESY